MGEVLSLLLSSTWGRADQQTSHDSNRVGGVLFCAILSDPASAIPRERSDPRKSVKIISWVTPHLPGIEFFCACGRRRFRSPGSPLFAGITLLGLAPGAAADSAAFDLIGPRVDVRVQRAGVTLPIAEVPNLQAGDRLWIHPDLPDTQSVRYLMVVVFLRGATNPPPDSWFTRVETWSKPVHDEGVFVTVPEEAEEALVFLAPETGGAFSTLRAAVRGKPGAFVRASQDLGAGQPRPRSAWKSISTRFAKFPPAIPNS